MAIPSLTTETKVRIRLSTVGVNKRTDHEPQPASTIIADVISQASSDVAVFLSRYPLESSGGVPGLDASEVVSNWTADVAVYHLCRIRGNPVPVSVKERFEWVMEQLALVQAGKQNIPDLNNAGGAPAVINYDVQYDQNPKKRPQSGESYPRVRGGGYPYYPDQRQPWST